MIEIEEIPVQRIDEFWKIHFAYLIEDDIIQSEEDKAYFLGSSYRNMVRDHMLRKQDVHNLVYFVENSVRIGATQYCTYQSEDGKCFILDYWVFPAYRGDGCGHRCFRALEAYTKKSGAIYYELNCEREAALRFWKDLGFLVNGVDEYDMQLMIRR